MADETLSDFATWMHEWGDKRGAGQIYKDLADLCAQQHEALEQLEPTGTPCDEECDAQDCPKSRARDVLRAATEFQEKYG